MNLQKMNSDLSYPETHSPEISINSDNRVLVLNFDHSLFLSNSTEEYLDCARPKFLVAFVLAILSAIKPWRYLPGEQNVFVYRDAIRLFVITLIFPWTFLIWKIKTNHLSKKYTNTELLEIINGNHWKKIIIISYGFSFIINPLIKKIDIDNTRVTFLGSRLFTPYKGSRGNGKIDILFGQINQDEINYVTFITSNKEDIPLLKIVNQGLFVQWPNTKKLTACQNTYVPFVYTETSNRGHKGHVTGIILKTNLVVITLAYGLSNGISINLFLGLLFLVLSFWCVYEAGYYENDLHELKYEETKAKGRRIKDFIDYPMEVGAWIAGLLCGVLGLLFLDFLDFGGNDEFILVNFIFHIFIWILWLLGARLSFRIYNYSSPESRLLYYLILQVFRLGGPLLFMPLNVIGLSLIIAQAAARWVYYIVYKTRGNNAIVRKHTIRLLLFLLLICGYAASFRDIYIFASWQFILIFTWCLLLSIKFRKIKSNNVKTLFANQET